MTNVRPGGRGGRAARRANAEQRWQDELTERGALSDYDDVRERVNAEKLECPYCFKPVHPDNFGAHMEMYHPEVPNELSLTDRERDELARLEIVIEQGLDTFYEVGQALLHIRDTRLYRETHSTFEDYCRERWDISGRRANMLVAASMVISNLGTIVPNLPANEAQARPLAALEPEAQRIVWDVVQQTAPDGKVTAAHVKSVANVFREVMVTGSLDNGEGESVAVSDAVKAAITEETYERMKRQEAHINEKALFSSKSAEWYTPQEIARRIWRVMGSIDLDPCSTVIANTVIGASRFYEAAGLEQDWTASTVYLNPPYGNEISAWVERLLAAVNSHEVKEAIALLPARTDTAWFRLLRDYPRCFLFGRLKFWTPNGTINSAPFPSMMVYFGQDVSQFASVFGEVGDVYVRLME